MSILTALLDLLRDSRRAVGNKDTISGETFVMSPLATLLTLLGGAVFFVAPLVIAGDTLRRVIEEMRRDGIEVYWWCSVHAIHSLRSRMASASTCEELEKYRRWWRTMKWAFVLSLIPFLYVLTVAGLGLFLGLDPRVSRF